MPGPATPLRTSEPVIRAVPPHGTSEALVLSSMRPMPLQALARRARSEPAGMAPRRGGPATGNHDDADLRRVSRPAAATTPNTARHHGASCVGLAPTGRPCRKSRQGACCCCRPLRRNEAAVQPAPWPQRCAASVSPPAPWPQQAPRASATPARGTGREPARRPLVTLHRPGRACARAPTGQGQGHRGALPTGPARGRSGDLRVQ